MSQYPEYGAKKRLFGIADRDYEAIILMCLRHGKDETAMARTTSVRDNITRRNQKYLILQLLLERNNNKLCLRCSEGSHKSLHFALFSVPRLYRISYLELRCHKYVSFVFSYSDDPDQMNLYKGFHLKR
jgi:hypothetical protein